MGGKKWDRQRTEPFRFPLAVLYAMAGSPSVYPSGTRVPGAVEGGEGPVPCSEGELSVLRVPRGGYADDFQETEVEESLGIGWLEHDGGIGPTGCPGDGDHRLVRAY
jgi:hypothetical protein